MTKADKVKLKPEARKLYAEGWNMTRICEQLEIGSRTTLAGWMDEDKGTENDWEEARRKKLGCDPYAPVRAARKRVEWLTANQEKFLDDPGYDDRLNKALLNLDKIEQRYGSADRILEVMEQLAVWARINLTKPANLITCGKCATPVDSLAVLHDITDRFTRDVRAGELEVNA